MSIIINILTVLTGFILIGTVFKLIAARKMSEAQSILWILIGITTIVIGIFPQIINILAKKLGIWYAPSLTFLIAYVGLLFIVFRNTVMISIQSNQINELFMQVILLKKENEYLKSDLKTKEEGELD